ncbi:MAG: PDZ domain-containing protein [Terriglobales bacterium]
MPGTFLKIFLAMLLPLATGYGQAAAPPSAASKSGADKQQWRYFRGGYLGVDIRDIAVERAAALGLQNSRGVEITMVDQDAPAAQAGLKEHDVILSFNGMPVQNVATLRHMIVQSPPGRTVTLGISRDGQPMTVKVQLAQHKHYAMVPGRSVRLDMPKVQMPDIEMPRFSMLQFSWLNGLLLEDITPQLGEFFGVKDGQGVLVRSVNKGSPAAAAGLKAGDVIIKANNERITCTSDWARVMHERRGDTVVLGIVRDKHEQTVSLKLPERKTSDATIHIEVPDISGYLDELSSLMRDLQPQIERSVRVAQADLERFVRNQQDVFEEMQRRMRRSERERERERRRGEQPQVPHPIAVEPAQEL